MSSLGFSVISNPEYLMKQYRAIQLNTFLEFAKILRINSDGLLVSE